MNTTFQEILDASEDSTNVKSITYNNDTKEWTIRYRNALINDVVESEDLLEFLLNG